MGYRTYCDLCGADAPIGAAVEAVQFQTGILTPCAACDAKYFQPIRDALGRVSPAREADSGTADDNRAV